MDARNVDMFELVVVFVFVVVFLVDIVGLVGVPVFVVLVQWTSACSCSYSC